MKFIAFNLIVVCYLIAPIVCSRINSRLYEEMLMQGKQSQNTMDPVETSVSNRETHIVDGSANAELDRQRNMLAYVKTSIPIRIFQCMQRLNILKCMKIFILQRMERTTINTGNVTADFLDQILSNGPNGDGDASYDDILDKYYLQMSDPELNDRLQKSFQRFFHDREIKLHFIPGMVVKVVPNAENAINLSLKRGNTRLEANGRAKNRPGDYLVQLGVPAILMPAILMGSVLPFILPALKFATIFSGIINHAALLSAFAFLAKQAAFSHPESIKPVYWHGYHRRAADAPHFH